MNMMPGTGMDTSLAGKEDMKRMELDWTHPEEGRRKMKRMEMDWTHPEEGRRI